MTLRRSRAAIAFTGVALLATALAGCSNAASSAEGEDSSDAAGYAVDSSTLVFGVVPDSVDTETNYQPLMDYIAAETGKTPR
jgi:phosphonate transport system substrate-binding protein